MKTRSNITLVFSVALALLSSARGDEHLDPTALSILKQSCEVIADADKFSVCADRIVDRDILPNEHAIGTAWVHALVRRPDQARIIVQGPKRQRRFFLGKDDCVVYNKNDNLYARFPGKLTLDRTIDAAREKLGVHIPMQDFLSNDPYQGLTSKLTSAKYLGLDRPGLFQDTCDHIACEQDGLKWEIWIARSDRLPRKFALTLTDVPGEDHIVFKGFKWNPESGLSNEDLVFTPPAGSEEIQFLPEELTE